MRDRRRGEFEKVELSELIFTLFLSVGLPLLLILAKPQEGLREAAEIYCILGALAWFANWLIHPNWLKYRGFTSLTAMAINAAVMFISGGIASQLASQRTQGLIIVPATMSSVVTLVERTWITAVLAFLVGWVEELLYGGLVYGVLDGALRNVYAKVGAGIIFAWMHVPAYIPGASPFDLAFLSDPRAFLLLAPLITRIVQCYLIDWEGGIVGVSLGHGLGDFLILWMGA
ncbi:MAG: CPBP family glutamic-type intramembrane protease [Desulfurococcaceae archaeon]